MVGPWQVPVADCAVTATGFTATTGEAMAMGERPALALLSAAASGRMAVAESLTNIAAAKIANLSDVRLSANWMAACGQGDEDARLFDAVRAVGEQLCPELGICIPVGKDSLSMKSLWDDAQGAQTQTAPVSLIVTAFAPVSDVRRSLTPQLSPDPDTRLLLVDLGNSRNRLGGSALAQVFGELGEEAPDLEQPAQLKAAWNLIQNWNDGRLLAYHDRSDGGLLVTLYEMAFAGHCGLRIDLPEGDLIGQLFAEELGMVVQLNRRDANAFAADGLKAGLTIQTLGAPSDDDHIRILMDGAQRYAAPRTQLHQTWAETSYRLAALRDDPDCAREAFEALADAADPGLSTHLTFTPHSSPHTPHASRRPRVAILREQGVNSQAEMAWAFDQAGFESVDVHMTDILGGHVNLMDFAGLVACGGFSYGDVLGAGQGWASTIRFNARAQAAFTEFLAHPERFALGICNGCQMFAALKDLVPGAEHWPAFRRNRSEQFEARWTMVEVPESRSLFLGGMAGSRLPVAVAHGEGRAVFDTPANLDMMRDTGQIALRFIDRQGGIASHYPANPNGSPDGITGVCNADGRVTILMPHPERTVAGTTGSWWPETVRGHAVTPWAQMFQNARRWVR